MVDHAAFDAQTLAVVSVSAAVAPILQNRQHLDRSGNRFWTAVVVRIVGGQVDREVRCEVRRSRRSTVVSGKACKRPKAVDSKSTAPPRSTTKSNECDTFAAAAIACRRECSEVVGRRTVAG